MEDKIRELDALLTDLQTRRATLVSLAGELRSNVAQNQQSQDQAAPHPTRLVDRPSGRLKLKAKR